MTADGDEEVDAATYRWDAAVENMAATPAEGVRGIFAKASRLCDSLDGCTIMHVDAPLAASLKADLARLVFEVLA